MWYAETRPFEPKSSVCLTVHMEQLVSHWMDFDQILYLKIFLTSVEKIQVSLKYDKNNGYFVRIPLYICDKTSLNR